ncbi:uncharacterized protein LOC118771893 [Megalops cyprinoides]|uniref:uncharacterized protein LOC118771893 n=1 Tax=Megalops cyprinoides TaxID=118141 RepID=UPI0018652FD4|nr:uncharacterized protein LOC118771893 [Megalops cyprinoides]
MTLLYSPWEVFDAVSDLGDDIGFHGSQESKLVGKLKCESLDERNIIISPRLLGTEVSCVSEEPSGRDSCGEILLPLISSSKALEELQKHKETDIPNARPFHMKSSLPENSPACEQCVGQNSGPTSLDISKVKQLIPVTQRLFSPAPVEPTKKITFGRQRETPGIPQGLISADHTPQPCKVVCLQKRAAVELVDPRQESSAARGRQRVRSHSADVSADEVRAASRRSASLLPGHVGAQARDSRANRQPGCRPVARHRSPDRGQGPGGRWSGLRYADYWQSLSSGLTHCRTLPSTHLHPWTRGSGESCQGHCSTSRLIIRKSGARDGRGTGGSAGHLTNSNSEAAMPKDMRCQSRRCKPNPEPPETVLQQHRDFTVKHILQVLQGRLAYSTAPRNQI